MPRTHEGPTPMTARNPEARRSRSTLNSAPETESASRTHNLPGGGSTRPGNEGPARRPRSGRPVRLTTESPSGPPRGLRPPRERPPCLWTAAGGHAHPSSRAPRGTPARCTENCRSARSACSPSRPPQPAPPGALRAVGQGLRDRGGFLRDKPHCAPAPAPRARDERLLRGHIRRRRTVLGMAGYAFRSLAWPYLVFLQWAWITFVTN